MTMYNDFLDRRMELEGGGPAISSDPVGAVASSVAAGIPLSATAGATAINGTTLDNVPNISSPEAAALIQNIPPGIAASAQVQAVAAASLQSAISNQIAISASQTMTPSLLATVQPADIAAASAASSSTLQVNLQIMPEGFGSYLDGILPKDLATAAGAFSATMQQIKNIRNIPIEKFAQVAATLELATRGLNLVNGTDLPTDVTEAAKALKLIALGSGPYGTYTYSDFFGCMSGLKYPWAPKIQPAIFAIQTSELSKIYQQLFLAVTWERGEVTIQQRKYYKNVQPYIPPTYEPFPPYDIIDPGQPRIDNWFYTVTTILVNRGGGYGRENAPPPVVTFTPNNCGASATTTIGTATPDAMSNGGGTYGRITGYTFNAGVEYLYATTSVDQANAPSPPSAPTEYVNIQSPPTTMSGSNTAGVTDDTGGGSNILVTGWPAMNSTTQTYIDQANAEIARIRSVSPGQAVELNDMWDDIGTQLTIEQSARNLALKGPPSPNEPLTRIDYGDLYPYPTMLYSFTDLVPNYSKMTEPNMAVQTLEAISDQDKNAGQSVIAMMRAERNKARLIAAGISTDDTIEDVLPPDQAVALIVNGTLSWAPPGVTPTLSNILTSAPASPFNTEPAGYFDPATKNFLINKAPVITQPGQAISPNNPANPFNTTTPTNPITNPSQNTITVQPSILGAPSPAVAAVLGIGTPGNIPIITGDIGIGSPGISAAAAGVVNNGTGAGGGAGGGGGTTPGAGGGGSGGTTPGAGGGGGITPGAGGGGGGGITPGAGGGGGNGVAVAPSFFAGPGAGGGLGAQGGGPIVPGSLAGSPYTKLIPPSLNPIYTSGSLLPASLPVQAAIEEVIRCNCDCWIQ